MSYQIYLNIAAKNEHNLEIQWQSPRHTVHYTVEFSPDSYYKLCYYKIFSEDQDNLIMENRDLRERYDKQLIIDKELMLSNLGSELFSKLFPADREYLWEELFQEESAEIVIWPIVAPMIPLEALRHPSIDYLAHRCSFIHCERNIKKEATPLLISGPLKVLVGISSPEGQNHLDYDKESESIYNALKPLIEKQKVIFKILPECTRSELITEINAMQPHIFIFSGHGGSDSKGSFIIFETSAGTKDPVYLEGNDRSLAGMLQQAKNLVLLYLSSCRTCNGNSPKISQQLLSVVPFVIGIGGNIFDSTAIYITQHFFYGVSQGFSFGESLCKARHELYINQDPKLTRHPDWVLPCLFGRFPSYPLFEIKKSIDFSQLSLDPKAFVGRYRELRELRKNIQNGKRAIVLYGAEGVGKSALAQKIAQEQKLPLHNIQISHLNASILLEQFYKLLKDRISIKELRVLQNTELKLDERLQQASKWLYHNYPHALVIHNFEEIGENINLEANRCLQILHESLIDSTQGLLILTTRHLIKLLKKDWFTFSVHELQESSLKWSLQPIYSKLTEVQRRLLSKEVGGNPGYIEQFIGFIMKNPQLLEKESELESQKLRLTENSGLLKLRERLKLPERELLARIGLYRCPVDQCAIELQIVNILTDGQKYEEKQKWVELQKKAANICQGALNIYRSLSLIEIKKISGKVLFFVPPIVAAYFAQDLSNQKRKMAHVVAADFFQWRRKQFGRSSDALFALEHFRTAQFYEESRKECHELFIILKNMGDWNKACSIVKEEISIITNDLDKKQLLFDLVDINLNQGKYDEAMEICNNLRDISKKTGDEQSFADVYHEIGKIYYQWSNFDEALKYYHVSLSLRKKLGDRIGIANSYYQLGRIYEEKNMLDEAMEYHKNALNIYRDLQDDLSIADSFHAIGIIYLDMKNQDMKNLDKAMDYYQNSLDIYIKLRNLNRMSYSYYQIARVLQDTNKLESLRYYQEFFSLKKVFDEPSGIADCCHQKGRILQDLKRFDEAMYFYQYALKIHEKLNEGRRIANACHNIATIYAAQNEPHKAIDFFYRTLHHEQKIGNQKDIEDTLISIKELLENLEDNQKDDPVFIKKIYKIFNELQYPERKILDEVMQRFSIKLD